MKTYNKILYLFLATIFVVTSCTKEQEFIPSLHIVSFINPDEPFKVQIQKTAPTLGDHSNLTIENAVVRIENNSTQEIVKMFHEGDGIYVSGGKKPAAGFDYQIQVSAEGFPDAAATTYVPDLGDVAVILEEGDSENDELEFSFSPTMLSNKPSNFFAYELVYNKPVEVNTDEEEEEAETENGSTVNTGNVGGSEDGVKTLRPVMGIVYDGSSVPVQAVNTLNASIEELSVRIVAVSSDFYDYLITQSEEVEYISSSVLSNNSKVYTNFVGEAYGIFGGFNEKTIKLVQ